MKKLLFIVAVLPALAWGKPMIDEAHDRVQTTLDPQMERIGTLKPRSAREVGPSRLAVGCEMLPREYGDFEKFKEYMPPLGLARVRLHAGWAKLEPKQGVWNWEWLDRQVNWLIENGMEPLLETSYGNPAYPGAGGASLSDGIPTGETALAAWDNYVEQLAKRYPQVKNWACWNEPSNCKGNTPASLADNNIRTAQIIKRIIPDAKIGMLVLSSPNLPYTQKCFEVFKERNALRLFHWAIMHSYAINPDSYYERAEPWAEFVKKEAPHLVIWNGESGATSDPHYSAQISSMKWNSELTQSKWDARRLIGDLGHGWESLVFTFYDPCYDYPERYCKLIPQYWVRERKDRFMKRMGLVKCNDQLEVTKVKMAYYTVQNIATLFDASIVAKKFYVAFTPYDREVVPACYTFMQKGTKIPLIAFWDATKHPVNDNVVKRGWLMTKANFEDPVWIDMVTGAIYEIPTSLYSWGGPNRTRKMGIALDGVPFYDAPVVITERKLVMPVE